MRKVEIIIGDMYVRQGFAKPVPKIPEDTNILFYKNGKYLELDLIRRARAVLGLRGVSTAATTALDGNAVRHGLRQIVGGFEGTFNVDEHVVAEYAVHIANESAYWTCDDRDFGTLR